MKENIFREIQNVLLAIKKEYFSIFIAMTVSYGAVFGASSLDISEVAVTLNRSKLVHNY